MGALLIAIGALAGSAGGLVSVVLNALRHTAAERKMKQNLKKDDPDKIRLEELAKHMEGDPDLASLPETRKIVSSLAGTLTDSEKSDILGVLDRGSDRSNAKLYYEAGYGIGC